MSATSRPTTARKKVVHPDSDGRRMADNTRQFQWIVTIKEGLEILFRDRPDVFVAGDLLWYAREGEPDGQPFLAAVENAALRQRARQQAEAAERRAERLVARLRELGIEPE